MAQLSPSLDNRDKKLFLASIQKELLQAKVKRKEAEKSRDCFLSNGFTYVGFGIALPMITPPTMGLGVGMSLGLMATFFFTRAYRKYRDLKTDYRSEVLRLTGYVKEAKRAARLVEAGKLTLDGSSWRRDIKQTLAVPAPRVYAQA